ncbi:hypothetical protein F4556_006783 [Kitasatospora gansuensis]|uniref:Uncharacterized protein n=1 Tax=Kitasatospora gansuensis TaxID=258050 RepID=A0A7W7SJX5_9ACTN|nr:hypothetical protein [Kitasatospora gansuensis]MBB4951248.1 hypothetical protein [Kitasatospora gansuensis]
MHGELDVLRRVRPRPRGVAADDRMIPPAAQRQMAQRAGATFSEVNASHSGYVSQAQATADLIKRAAANGR